MPLKSFYWTNRDRTNVWPLDVVAIYKSNPKDIFFGSSLLVNYDYVDQGRTESNGTTSIFLIRLADPTQALVIPGRRAVRQLPHEKPRRRCSGSWRQTC